MSTPNLAIVHVAASQNNKEVTANTAFDELDGAVTDLLAVTMTTADYTLATGAGGEARGHLAYKLTGTIGAARNLVVPAAKKLYVVSNQTTGGYAVTVKTPSGTGVALSDADYHILYCDGTNVVALAPGLTRGPFIGLSDVPSSYSGANSQVLEVNSGATAVVFARKPFDVPSIIQGVGVNNQVLAYFVPCEPVKFLAGASGSTAVAKAAATASTTYTFLKNGTPFATCVFAISGTTGTWTQASDATFNGTSDVLEIDGPATADATLANIGMVLRGQRTS